MSKDSYNTQYIMNFLGREFGLHHAESLASGDKNDVPPQTEWQIKKARKDTARAAFIRRAILEIPNIDEEIMRSSEIEAAEKAGTCAVAPVVSYPACGHEAPIVFNAPM